MSAKHGTGYTLGFAAAVCLVCSVFVCLSAVGLKSKQELNKELDKQKNVLKAAGLMTSEESLAPAEIEKRFEAIETVVIDLKTGEEKEGIDPKDVNMLMAVKDPALSRPVEANGAKVLAVPNDAIVYKYVKDGTLDMIILPVNGKGLWSTMYGFLALGADGDTIKGISFYQHGETPGLGGEIEQPYFTDPWKGRKVLGPDGQPNFKVLKGQVKKSPEEDPNNVDGLSGATLTCNGVTGTVNFWVGEQGYGPFLQKIRGQKGGE